MERVSERTDHDGRPMVLVSWCVPCRSGRLGRLRGETWALNHASASHGPHKLIQFTIHAEEIDALADRSPDRLLGEVPHRPGPKSDPILWVNRDNLPVPTTTTRKRLREEARR